MNTRAGEPREDHHPHIRSYQLELHSLWHVHGYKISNLEGVAISLTLFVTPCDIFTKPGVICNWAAFSKANISSKEKQSGSCENPKWGWSPVDGENILAQISRIPLKVRRLSSFYSSLFTSTAERKKVVVLFKREACLDKFYISENSAQGENRHKSTIRKTDSWCNLDFFFDRTGQLIKKVR